MESIIDVNTGEVKVSGKGSTLRSGAIGSCMVIAAFDPVQWIGGMAHIMVPGRCISENQENRTRYAEDGIEELIRMMEEKGSIISDIRTCMIGGGNVLRREEDTIAFDNINSVAGILTEKDIPVLARSIGGYERRSAILDLDKAAVMATEGNGSLHHLFDFVRQRSQGENRK